MVLDIWIIIIIGLAIVALAAGLLHNSRTTYNEVDLISRIALLQSEIEKKDLAIEDYKRRNMLLSERVEELESRVRDLELVLYGKSMRGQLDLSVLNPPLLLIAVDPYIQRQDEIALNKAKMPYRRVIQATQDKIEQELRSARQQKAMYKYIMFSAHSGTTGVKMHDGTFLDGYWMNTNLVGAEIVFLNGCKTTEVADSLINVASYVISMMEDVPTKAAQSFAEIFWTSILKGDDANTAFQEALSIEPTVRPYAVIRDSV